MHNVQFIMHSYRGRYGICKFFLEAILILLCNYGMAQGFFGGLSGGFTTSQVDGDEHDGFHRIGGYGGVFVQRTFQNNWCVPEFGLTFSQKGAASADRSFKTTIGYVDAQFLINGHPGDFLEFIPHQLCITIGTIVSAKAYENIRIADIQKTSNDFNRIDWQACAGLGYDVARIRLTAQVSYSIIPNNKRYYNYAVWFGAKYFLPKGKKYL